MDTRHLLAYALIALLALAGWTILSVRRRRRDRRRSSWIAAQDSRSI